MLSMLLCVSMLVGSTFAWFTDTASTTVNSIQAGTLDVELWKADSDEALGSTALTWVKAAGHTEESVLWEPGCTYNLESFRIKNNGNLALKYKVIISGIVGDAKLLEAIDFTVSVDGTALVAKDGTSTVSTVADLNNFEGTLAAGAVTGKITITGTMKTTAGNEYQNLSIDGISITVYATQYTAEYDSINNQYDKDAPIVYPEGVTTGSFESATSVYYTNNGSVDEDTSNGHSATVVYVDGNGGFKYAADLPAAMKNGATVVYCKAGSDVSMVSAHEAALSGDLTLYANGANFNDGDIAFGMGASWNTGDIDLKIYDANNLYVWGYSPADNTTVNVLMENCHNVGTSATSGAGRMFYISGETGTINATLRNCSVEKCDSPVYMNANGSLTVENCTFIKCAVPVNINHKASGTRADSVKNCSFIDCGCTADMSTDIAKYSAPIRFVKSGTGTLNVTLTNNTFTGTLGTNGDILLGDYRTGKTSNGFTANITAANSVMVKSSTNAAYSYDGGTINVTAK